jgi:hypothetical protein
MSRHNKVNKDAYVQRGRLTPDEMAQERMKQAQVSGRAKGKENVIGKAPSRPDVIGREVIEKENATAKAPSRPGERGSTRRRNEREE